MTAVQLNAMHTELLQNIGILADDEAMMRRLTRYTSRLVKEKEAGADPACMSEEEFFARVDNALEEARQGKVYAIGSEEELHRFLNSL